MRVLMVLAGISALVWAGCDDIAPPQRRAPLAPPGIDIPQATQPAPQAAGPAAPAAQPQPGAQPQPQPAGQPPAAAPGTERVEAGVGVGKKGHYGGGGPLVTPVEVYWRAQEKITFEQVKHTLNLYKATNDNKGPATHEEFMQKIIKEGMIKLPELPAGHRYVYDPKQEQLLVERPANP